MTPDEILAAIESLSEDDRRRLLSRLDARYPRRSPSAAPIELPAPGAPAALDAVLTFDGGSSGNPGPAFGSFALQVAGGKPAITRLRFGRLTNNEAEYETLIRGLTALQESLNAQGQAPGDVALEIRGDSALVINQLKGEWKVKEPRLRPLRDQARALISRFKSVRLVHQPRAATVRVLGH